MREAERLKAQIRESKRAAITSHQNADPDAVCAALALRYLLKEINPRLRASFIFPDGVSEVSGRILQFYNVRPPGDESFRDADILFIVDASSTMILGPLEREFREYTGKVAVIDHHPPAKNLRAAAWLPYIDEAATSASEVVFNLFESARIKIPKRIAQIILTGMMFDSGYFSIATANTFRVAAALCSSGARVEDSRALLQSRMSRSEKIARLKAAQRCTVKDINGWIFVWSQVKSHQASAARALLNLGADIAMVQGGEQEDFRINFRASYEFTDKTGIHLGRDVAQPLGQAFKGEGGGHDRAAGFNIKESGQETSKLVDHVINILKEKIGAPVPETSESRRL